MNMSDYLTLHLDTNESNRTTNYYCSSFHSRIFIHEHNSYSKMSKKSPWPAAERYYLFLSINASSGK